MNQNDNTTAFNFEADVITETMYDGSVRSYLVEDQYRIMAEDALIFTYANQDSGDIVSSSVFVANCKKAAIHAYSFLSKVKNGFEGDDDNMNQVLSIISSELNIVQITKNQLISFMGGVAVILSTVMDNNIPFDEPSSPKRLEKTDIVSLLEMIARGSAIPGETEDEKKGFAVYLLLFLANALSENRKTRKKILAKLKARGVRYFEHHGVDPLMFGQGAMAALRVAMFTTVSKG